MRVKMGSLAIQRSAHMVFAHFLAVLCGGVMAAEESTRIEWMLVWTLSIALVLLCATDARIHCRPIPRTGQLVMWLVWPVAVPVYCLWARRWRGLLWLVGLGVTMLCCFLAGAVAFEYASAVYTA